MALSSDLISQLVKVNKEPKKATESTSYGTTVSYEGRMYVKLDGSDLLTPINSTSSVKDGDRVTVLIKEHTATVTGNMSDPSASSTVVETQGKQISNFEIVIADKVSTKELDAERGRIDELVSDNVFVKEKLTATEAEITDLQAENVTITEKLTAAEATITELETSKLDAEIADIKYATVDNLNATDAKIYNLEATYGEFKILTSDRLDAAEATIETLDSTYATVKNLDAEKARIDVLEADSAIVRDLQAEVADIDTLIFGSASGSTIQTSFANAVIVQLGNAQIKSAMIESLSADKITAGDIITNNVRVMSKDGALLISDETIQISDGTRVRVQIGKDAANDYSINIWDANGNLMFSEGGITDSAIKDAIIRNDMVASDANIAASKLDISSLFTEINGSTETIKSSKILMDAENQTLDVAFTQMSSDVSGLSDTVTTHGTAISTIQGQISSKIWLEDIGNIEGDINADVYDRIYELNTQYTELSQEVDDITATVASHTTEIDAVTNEVVSVSDTVTQMELDLDGFKTTVSETYATKNDVQSDLDGLSTRVSTAETKIEQNTNAIELRALKSEVSDTLLGYYNKEETEAAISVSTDSITSSVEERFTNLQIGGRNLILGTGTADGWTKHTAFDLTNREFSRSTTVATECFIYSPGFDLEAGETYTLSFKAKQNGYVTGSEFYILPRTFATTGVAYYGKIDVGTEYEKYVFTFVPYSKATSLIDCQLRFDNDGSVSEGVEAILYIKDVKLEKGNKATDWTPAPEDMATAKDLESYSTKTELEQTANSITTTVSTTYATKQSVEDLEVGGRNLLLNSNSFVGDNVSVNQDAIIDGTYAGLNAYSHDFSDATSGTVDILQFKKLYVEKLEAEYTLSFYAKGVGQLTTYFYGASDYVQCATTTTSTGGTTHSGDGKSDCLLTDTWTRYWVTWKLADEGDISIEKYILFRLYFGSSVSLCGIKLEKGNKATDWTPAPEDMATAQDVTNVQNSANEAQTVAGDVQGRVTVAESEIRQLANMIASLVTDEHGSSLMTQTSGGWTFNISDIINKLDNTTQDVDTLTGVVTTANSDIDTLKQAVNDLGILTDYVIITTYNGQPCIELGEGENEFKLRITNTEIQFADGTVIPAYVSNKKLMIEQAEVKNELQFGGFVWKARSNRNIGLIWKG